MTDTTLPHAAYMDAVHDALVKAGIATNDWDAYAEPDPEAYFHWRPNHPALDKDSWPSGARLVWDYPRGWMLVDPADNGDMDINAGTLADPASLVALITPVLASGASLPRQALEGEWEHATTTHTAIENWEG
jgi:hypothetical protein